MAAHKVHVTGLDPRRAAGFQAGIGGQVAQVKVQQADLPAVQLCTACHLQNFLPRRIAERQGDEPQLPHLGIGAAAAQFHHRSVNTVGAGAAHQADGDAGILLQKRKFHRMTS